MASLRVQIRQKAASCRRTFRFHFSMFARAEYRICQRRGSYRAGGSLQYAADFTFVAKQQSNSVAAMAEG